MTMTRISLQDLPPRAQRLNEEQLSQVFGGCLGWHYYCKTSFDCCSKNCVPEGSMFSITCWMCER